jgi:hypothetical protein
MRLERDFDRAERIFSQRNNYKINRFFRSADLAAASFIQRKGSGQLDGLSAPRALKDARPHSPKMARKSSACVPLLTLHHLIGPIGPAVNCRYSRCPLCSPSVSRPGRDGHHVRSWHRSTPATASQQRAVLLFGEMAIVAAARPLSHGAVELCHVLKVAAGDERSEILLVGEERG